MRTIRRRRGIGVAVKRIQSAARVLSVLEGIARHQPVGVSALSRLLDDDKSAIQRAIMTLADEGWIRSAPGLPVRWELTAHIHVVAHMGHDSNDLRQRARPALRAVRDECGESVLLTVPDVGQLVVIDVAESRYALRFAPRTGTLVPVRDSAAGRAMLPHMRPERQIALLGGPPDEELLVDFADVLARGYTTSHNRVQQELRSVAAAILGADGEPIGAIVATGPPARVTDEVIPAFGAAVLKAARSLSRARA